MSGKSVACPNCEAPMATRFCGACGQRNAELHLTARELLMEVAEHIFGVDGKLRPTLRGLFIPGFLTEEFRRGRRARYHRPLEVFLVAAGLLFFVRSCGDVPTSSPRTLSTAEATIRNGLLKMSDGLDLDERDVAPRIDNLLAHTPPLIEFLRTPKGLLLWVLITAAVFTFWFRKTHASFSDHFAYALHVGAFAALAYAVARVAWLPWPPQGGQGETALLFGLAGLLGRGAALLYGLGALRRVYCLTWLQALWQWAVLLVLEYAVAILLGMAMLMTTVVFALRDLLF